MLSESKSQQQQVVALRNASKLASYCNPILDATQMGVSPAGTIQPPTVCAQLQP